MLVIDHLTAAYKQHVVICDLSLSLAPGEVLGLIGPNGAGKSSLIRAISGLLPPQSGEITWMGDPIVGFSPARRARIIAVVPQAEQLGGAFTVEETILLGRTPYMGWLGKPSAADHAAVRQAMQQTRVDHLGTRRNAELSGGEQQRVLLARALAQQTPVLLLDEPTNHLDLQHQVAFLSLVVELAHSRQMAVLLAAHDLNHVAQYATRVALLADGKLAAAGTPDEVLTPENILSAYHVSVYRFPHPQSGVPLILPDLSRWGDPKEELS